MSTSTAVFLGAGASKAFGFPLTTELLPLTLQLLDGHQLMHTINVGEVDARAQGIFRERLYAFLPGLEATWTAARKGQSPHELPKLSVTLTDLLSLVDHALASGGVRATMTSDDLQEFRQSLERAVCSVLWHAERPDRQTSIENERRARFVDWLLKLQARGALSLITTNYDLVVDLPLFERLATASHESPGGVYKVVPSAVDFGFAWRDPGSGELVPRPLKPQLRLLKLHGSLNTLRCPLCHQTYLNVFGYVAHEAFRKDANEHNTCHCADWARLRVNLVTPSLVRQIQDASLLGIWQAAMEALRTADEWLLIGYSLPSEDVAIRSMLVRAWEGRTKKPSVVVVQHGDAARQIHEVLFPQSQYFSGGLGEYLDMLRV